MSEPHVISEIGGYGVHCSCGEYFAFADAVKLTDHLKIAKPFSKPKSRPLDPEMVARWVVHGNCPKCGCPRPPDRNSMFWQGNDAGTVSGCILHGAGCGLVFDFPKKTWHEDPAFFDRQAAQRRRDRAQGR